MRDAVERAMRGDREAFGLLVGQTSDRLYAIATRILRDADLAEDALQGALITAWRELPRLRDPDRFDAWLNRLLTHAAIDEARRRRRRVIEVELGPLDAPIADPIHGLF
ncbi:MAG TPA: sigma factor, partial [Candidatus Limnocylindrales bacterium]|nr:sigma factor [Candidatus Limnocylindrales bacterium]